MTMEQASNLAMVENSIMIDFKGGLNLFMSSGLDEDRFKELHDHLNWIVDRGKLTVSEKA